MNSDFPRILTLLRKEKGISQKQAAAHLNISQALLSHYEKGIRECGLDFIIKTSDFYNVSCDYLLGRSPERNGATLSFEDIPEQDTLSKDNKFRGSLLPVLNKKLINNTLSILFDLLQKLNNNELTTEMSNYLMICVYDCFRTLYNINPKNENSLFTIPANDFSNLSIAKILKIKTSINSIINNGSNSKDPRFKLEPLHISTSMLQDQYSVFSSSLLNLVKTSENSINE